MRISRHWIAFADFYQWPHITLFDSLPDLMEKLSDADLPATSRSMTAYNLKTKEDLVSTWKGYFHKMFHGLEPAALQPRLQIADFDAAIEAKYGATVSKSCVGDKHAGVPASEFN